MNKNEMDAIPDAAWNAMLAGDGMQAIRILRDRFPLLGLTGVKHTYDLMRREFGLPVYDDSDVLR